MGIGKHHNPRGPVVHLGILRNSDLRMEDLVREKGQSLTEYAVMLAVLLVLALGVCKYVGSAIGSHFSNAAKVIAQ